MIHSLSGVTCCQAFQTSSSAFGLPSQAGVPKRLAVISDL